MPADTRFSLDLAPDAVVTFDARGRIVELNRAAVALLAAPGEGLAGRPLEELITSPGPDHEGWSDLANAMSGREPGTTVRLTTTARRAGGTLFPAELTLSRLSDSPRRYAAWLRDVTARERAVAEAQRHRALLERAEGLSGVGSWEWSPERDELLWSDAMYRLYGLEPGALTPSPQYVFEHVHPDDRDMVQAAVERLDREATLSPLEYRFIRPDGEVRLLRAMMAIVQESAAEPKKIVGSLQDITDQRSAERELSRHLVEQQFQARLEEALSDIAATVAAGRDSHTIVEMVAERLASVLDVPTAAVMRFDSRLHATWLAGVGAPEGVGDEVPLAAPFTATLVARTGRAQRIDDWSVLQGEAAEAVTKAGLRTSLSVPVHVGGELWGCLTVAAREPTSLAPATERLVGRFAELVSTALANADARAHLERLATTDGLTGLCNHREFQERLRQEHRRARRHGRPLALAVFDVDGFKAINDQHGHQQGDHVLSEIGDVFAEHVRADDVSARIGGDEFAVIAPDTDAAEAFLLAERIRVAAGDRALELELPFSLSAGVAEIDSSEDAAELLRLADGALYWAKRHGRNMTVRYSRDVVRELSAEDRARSIERLRTLHTLRALARAVDAKDPSTREHSNRVAEVAHALAVRLGWEDDRAARLRDAAVLHDVGKIGVPDHVLFKPGRLDADEYEQVKVHAALGAQIVDGVLDAEQIAWVRSHHERLDGGGYPDGLAAEAIPDGARVLAVADAYDSIVSARPYKAPVAPAVAIERIRDAAGRQFDDTAVEALEHWLREGSAVV